MSISPRSGARGSKDYYNSKRENISTLGLSAAKNTDYIHFFSVVDEKIL